MKARMLLATPLIVVCAMFGSQTLSGHLAQASAENEQSNGSFPTAVGTPTVLPRPDFHFPGNVGRTYLDSDPPSFRSRCRRPKGAPNVVLILLDDAGFGQFSTFGGGVPSPTMDRLAAEGLRYNRFHTTALCSPTRAALITGRNHHSAAFAGITEAATGYDGYTGILPRSTRHDRRGAAAERLHDRLDRQEPQHADLGDERRRPVRPLGQRPGLRLLLRLQRRRHEPLEPDAVREPEPGPGLDRPELPPDDRPRRQGHRLGAQGEDASPRTSRSSCTSRPAPRTRRTRRRKEWIDKFKGKFDKGWDAYREETFARQKKLGVVPPDAEAHDAVARVCRPGTRSTPTRSGSTPG